ncbi:HNH endonuclease [Paenibacillus sp. FSL K6-2859]|jgi:5-methylcytosine-specific restriction protein A|uniref:HNH endonuclease n=1 Tax=Paenibacillus sp. FSL K6-2859 TaxID=2921482 RepID=UPI0030F7C0CB
MNRINLINVITRIENRYGLPVILNIIDKESLEIRPLDLDKGTGFCIKVTLGWRNIVAEFIPDNYSKNLISIMGLADEKQKLLFKIMLLSILHSGKEIEMIINNESFSPSRPDSWPSEWKSLYLKSVNYPVISERLSSIDLQNNVVDIACSILALLIPLLPLEETATGDETTIGLPEGALTRVEVNKYERSSLNREACIMVHGCKCAVCKLEFESFYGPIGRDFIHVHHILPVSTVGSGYIINPSTDLVPVCPNCHSMLHKRNPPYMVEELKSIIAKKS